MQRNTASCMDQATPVFPVAFQSFKAVIAIDENEIEIEEAIVEKLLCRLNSSQSHEPHLGAARFSYFARSDEPLNAESHASGRIRIDGVERSPGVNHIAQNGRGDAVPDANFCRELAPLRMIEQALPLGRSYLCFGFRQPQGNTGQGGLRVARVLTLASGPRWLG